MSGLRLSGLLTSKPHYWCLSQISPCSCSLPTYSISDTDNSILPPSPSAGFYITPPPPPLVDSACFPRHLHHGRRCPTPYIYSGGFGNASPFYAVVVRPTILTPKQATSINHPYPEDKHSTAIASFFFDLFL